MEIAVVGGTGILGAAVARALRVGGESVRVLSRRSPEHPVDLTTGEGLAAALEGVDTVVEAANSTKKAAAVLVEGTERLLAAEAAAGVAHHVAISIVGCDRVPIGYYRTKVAQEEAVAAGPVPWTLLRAAQFHTLLDVTLRRAARAGISPRGPLRFQPIDPADVGARMADLARGGPAGRAGDLAGPRVHTLSELAGAWRVARGRRVLLPVPIPALGATGRAIKAGALCAPDAASTGMTFAEWLTRPELSSGG